MLGLLQMLYFEGIIGVAFLGPVLAFIFIFIAILAVGLKK